MDICRELLALNKLTLFDDLGERPYCCTYPGCTKRFTEYSSLYKHNVVHTHSKPYTCKFCSKTYRQTSTLAMHKRQAHGETCCEASKRIGLENFGSVTSYADASVITSPSIYQTVNADDIAIEVPGVTLVVNDETYGNMTVGDSMDSITGSQHSEDPLSSDNLMSVASAAAAAAGLTHPRSPIRQIGKICMQICNVDLSSW